MIKVTQSPLIHNGVIKEEKTSIYNVDDIHRFTVELGFHHRLYTIIHFSSAKESLCVTETPEELDRLISDHNKTRTFDKSVMHHSV